MKNFCFIIILWLMALLPSHTYAENITVYPITGQAWQATIEMIGKITLSDNQLQIISHSGTILYNEPLYLAHKIAFGKITDVPEIVADAQFQVYPNPCRDILHITGIEDNTPWFLFDVQGRLLQSGNNLEIDMQMIPSGVYFVFYKGQIQKIIKELF